MQEKDTLDKKTTGDAVENYIVAKSPIPNVSIYDKGSAIQKTRTMKGDLIEAKKIREQITINPIEKTPSRKNFLSIVWSKISGKEKVEAEIVKLAEEKKRIQDKEKIENNKAKVPIEAKVIAEAEQIKVAEEEKIEEGNTKVLDKKDVDTTQETTKIGSEEIATANRIISTVSTKASEVLATKEKALRETNEKTAEIIEEKEKVRTAIAKIVKEEEKSLSDIIKLVEKEENERANAIKTEASQKRQRAERDADLADISLAREKKEADEAETLAKKERAEAESAEIVAKKERGRANSAVEIEAKEILLADKQIQIAVDTATKEIISLQTRVRSEAEIITLAQEKSRESEAAEVAKITSISKDTR